MPERFVRIIHGGHEIAYAPINANDAAELKTVEDGFEVHVADAGEPKPKRVRKPAARKSTAKKTAAKK